jgi:membrane-bound lytic murein transglycosylase B
MRAVALVLACLAGATLTAQTPATPTAPQDTRPSFADWLNEVRAEALTRGIRPDVVDEALGQIDEPVPVVIERDRAQAETVLSLDAYISRRLTSTFIRTGRDVYTREKATLEAVSKMYGVPSNILASIWGIESNYGRFTGVRPTVSALATLAWDPRRSSLFRRELFDALEILNRKDIELAEMRGSWAGAMGQPQFMPSSYLKFAVDFDGDGRRDIWSSNADVLASIANYLKGKGWVEGQAWGREVRTTPNSSARIAKDVAHRDGGCRATRDMTVALPLPEWQKLGVRSLSGGPLPYTQQMASLVMGARRKFLVYQNYDALLEYNCANSYALTVALLSEEIASPPKPPAPKPVPKAPTSTPVAPKPRPASLR